MGALIKRREELNLKPPKTKRQIINMWEILSLLAVSLKT